MAGAQDYPEVEVVVERMYWNKQFGQFRIVGHDPATPENKVTFWMAGQPAPVITDGDHVKQELETEG
jgi:hypothetical protein